MTGPKHTQEIQELEDVEARLRAEDAAATGGSTSPAPGTSAEAAASGTSTDPNDRQAAQPTSPSVSDGGITQQASAPAPATDTSVAGSIGDTSGAAPATDAGSSSTDNAGAGSADTGSAPASDLPEGHPDHLGDVGDVGAIGAAGPQWEAAGLATEPSSEQPAAAPSPFADVVTSLTQIRVNASKVDDARAPQVVNAITAAIDAANVAQ
jgi:nicotinate-nucleotide--dimethylbenzimidazole phosphoribosyltransferase